MDDEGFWFPTPPHLKRRLGKRQRVAAMKPVDQCRHPGCPNDKRRVQGAAYCAEHARSIEYRLKHGTLAPIVMATCINCGKEYQYQKGPRTDRARAWASFCPDCRRATYLRWARLDAHGVSPELLTRWVRLGQTLACGLCARRFTDKTPPQIDHDHRHCAGGRGCGECVRDVLCQDCNADVGLLERMQRNGTLAVKLEYIKSDLLPKGNDERGENIIRFSLDEVSRD